MEQLHQGTGDNILGNKTININGGIDTSNLETFTISFLKDVSNQEFELAKNKLSGISELDKLDSEVKVLISALHARINGNNKETIEIKTKIKQLIRQSSITGVILDALSAMYLYMESLSNRDIAITWYNDLKSKGPFLNEIFNQFLANNEEIIERFRESHNLIENELIGLYHGSLLNNNNHLSLEIAEYLNKIYPSPNYEIYILHSSILILSEKTRNIHALSFPEEDKQETELLIDQLLKLAQDNNINKLALPLINLSSITMLGDMRLLKIINENLETLETLAPDFVKMIKRVPSQFHPDPLFLETHTTIKTEIEMINLLLNIIDGHIHKSSLGEWRCNGGEIKIDNSYIDRFFELMISAWLCDNKKKSSIINLELQAEHFLETTKDNYKDINPTLVTELTTTFLNLQLPILSIKFLEPFIPETPWISPLFENYLISLFYSGKYSVFFKKISLISSDKKSSKILFMESRAYLAQQDYVNAIKYNEKAIIKDPNFPSIWHQYIELLWITKNPKINNILENIPSYFFDKYKESLLPLLICIAKYINLNFVENIMLDWFIEDPNNLAIPISNFYFNTLEYRKNSHSNFEQTKLCVGAIIYKDDNNDELRKFLVKKNPSKNTLCVNVNTELGIALQQLLNNKPIDNLMYSDYDIIEAIHPFRLAIQEANNLRSKLNDGSDSFRVIKTPSDPEKLTLVLNKILKKYSSNDNIEIIMEDIKKSDLPLSAFSQFTHSHDLIPGVYSYLVSPEINKCFTLHQSGSKNPDKITIDIYTAIYFSLIGFISILKSKHLSIVISTDIKVAISDWLKKISDEKYLTISSTVHGLQRTTHQDINLYLKDFISELKLLLEISSQEVLLLKDIPENIALLQNILDPTVYSSLQLSICNGILLLSIDHFLCGYFELHDLPVVNVDHFISSHLSNSSYFQRKKSINQYLYTDLHIPIFYNDIIYLSTSIYPSDISVLEKLINKMGLSLSEDNSTLLIILPLIIINSVRSLIYKNHLEPEFTHYLVKLFNTTARVSMKLFIGNNSEEKLASFLFKIIYKFRGNEKFIKYICELAYCFSKGHFLNIPMINLYLGRLVSEET